MAVAVPYPKFRAAYANGNPLSGGLLYTFAPGSSTPKSTYVDQRETAVNTNPVRLDSRGEANVWLDGAYRMRLTDCDGVEQWDIDNINLTTEFVTLVSASGNSGLVAASGTIRLDHDDKVKARNAANTADINVLSLGSSTGAPSQADILWLGDSAGVQLGSASSTPLKGIRTLVQAVDFGSIAATTRGSVTISVSTSPAIATGDYIEVISGPESLDNGLKFIHAKAGTAEITLYCYNNTGSPIDPASASWTFLWWDLT